MKKCPLFIILILTVLAVSVPGAVVSVRNMNFAYPAAAVMIQTIKNRQFERIIWQDGQGLPDRMLYNADDGAEAAAVKAAGNETVSEDRAKSVSGNNDAGSDGNYVNLADARNADSEEADSDEDKEDDDVEAEDTDEDSDDAEHEEDGDYDDDSDDDGDSDDEDEDDEEEDDSGLKEFTAVDNDYFTDACFIGDSRVQGLGLYSDLPATNYGTVGMQLYRVFDKKVISTDMGKVTITDMLAVEPKYGKIYMGFGLNEMGWGNDEMFANYYYGLIDYIKAVQPDAILYIMGLIHVTEGEERRSSLYNNEAINKRNELLREIADHEHIYYLDLNEVFTDEYGRLATEDSFDGIHIKASAINKWADYLRTHAIVK